MITPAYSLTSTERVLPKLALDFTTASLDARVTVTRALNTATAVNSNGKIAIVNANLPRFDYSTTSVGTCKGLLIEEARTNICTYSEDLRNTTDAGSTRPWTYTNITLTPDAINSPDGTQNADKIVETTAAGAHRDYQTVTFTSGSAYTISIFAKAAERTRVAIISSDSIVSRGTGFNLSNGTTFSIGLTSPTTANIENYGDGWYRCWISYTPGGTSGNFQFYLCDASGNTSYTGNGTSGAYFWGSDVGLGAFPTSYIPTTTTSLTRNADAVTMTGTNFSSWWTSTIGAAVARVIPSTVSGIRPAAQFDDNSANNIIALRGNTTNPELYIKATTDQAQIDAGTISANTTYLLGGAWNTNDCAAAVNGGTAVPDTSVTVPTATQARLGSDGTNYLNGCLQSLRYWPQRVTNAEIQAFSK